MFFVLIILIFALSLAICCIIFAVRIVTSGHPFIWGSYLFGVIGWFLAFKDDTAGPTVFYISGFLATCIVGYLLFFAEEADRKNLWISMEMREDARKLFKSVWIRKTVMGFAWCFAVALPWSIALGL